MGNSKKHLTLFNRLNDLKKINFNIKKYSKNKSSIIIGPTSGIPEALQTVKDVYHIYEDGISQTYSTYFWPDINVETIDKKLIRYSTKDKSKLLTI